MIFLGSFIAIELMLILSLDMYIDGRRASRSIWIRSDVLVGLMANIAMVEDASRAVACMNQREIVQAQAVS